MHLYQHIAVSLQAMQNCKKDNNEEWYEKHHTTIESFIYTFLPHGSGFDSGTKLDFDRSTPNRLVFLTAYHHMNGGYYDGWTSHSVIVTPDLTSLFNLRVTGRNRNQTKDYIVETFAGCLSRDITRAEYCAACGVADDSATT